MRTIYYSIIQDPSLDRGYGYMTTLDSMSIDELLIKAINYSFDEEDFEHFDYKLCRGHLYNNKLIVKTIYEWTEPIAKSFRDKLKKLQSLK